MRRLDFFEFDMATDQESPLYSLILDNETIASPDPEGQDYLEYLKEARELGITHQDVMLYSEGKYEALFDLLERAARNPNFYVKRGN